MWMYYIFNGGQYVKCFNKIDLYIFEVNFSKYILAIFLYMCTVVCLKSKWYHNLQLLIQKDRKNEGFYFNTANKL